MGWPFQPRALVNAEQILAERMGLRGKSSAKVSRGAALAHSAVWAALRLRADLISSMPVDVFRRIDGVQVEQAKPKVFLQPSGPDMRWSEWVYATQVDLDSVGNTVGVILERDGNRLPSVIEMANIEDVSFKGKGSKLTSVKIGREKYDPSEVWHEKQYRLSGLPIGLSPLAYAARSINAGLSAQEFAYDWFSAGVVPSGHLKNVARVLDKADALAAKENFEASVKNGGLWVSGSDWEYSMLSAKASEAAFLETQEFSLIEICRFLGVPSDMIDAPVKGSNITYANITQRNLQLLIMNLGPAIQRREDAWSYGLLPQPRYAKLNTNAILRMDTKSRFDAYKVGIDSRIFPPSRVLDLENMPPLTPEEKAEFAELFPARTGGTNGPTA